MPRQIMVVDEIFTPPDSLLHLCEHAHTFFAVTAVRVWPKSTVQRIVGYVSAKLCPKDGDLLHPVLRIPPAPTLDLSMWPTPTPDANRKELYVFTAGI